MGVLHLGEPRLHRGGLLAALAGQLLVLLSIGDGLVECALYGLLGLLYHGLWRIVLDSRLGCLHGLDLPIARVEVLVDPVCQGVVGLGIGDGPARRQSGEERKK